MSKLPSVKKRGALVGNNRNVQTVLSILQFIALGVPIWFFVLKSSAYFGVSNHALHFLVLAASFATATVLTIGIHEGGHLIGAVLAGMTPIKARVGPFEFLRERYAWRSRWISSSFSPAHVLNVFFTGIVFAAPSRDKSLRTQYLAMVAAGPVANGVCAVVCLILARLFQENHISLLLIGFAAYNLGGAVANLIPTASPQRSDGMHLLAWFQGVDEDAPVHVIDKLLGLSIAGVDDEAIWQRAIAQLSIAAFPMPVISTYFRMKAAQDRADWIGAVKTSALLDQQLAGTTAAQAESVRELLALFSCELAFSRVMAGHAGASPIDAALTCESDWAMPCLRPRCLALHAAVVGNRADAAHWLGLSATLAERSIDRSMRDSESRLRAVISAKIDAR